MRNLFLFQSSYSRLAALVQQTHRRALLSAAYACRDVWETRHNEPALASKPSYELIFNVRNRFVRDRECSAIDLDVATCAVEHEDQLDELQRLVYDARHLPNPPVLMDSTQYAIGRVFLEHGRLRPYLEMIADPVNYGVFPENYCANLIMDDLLENGEQKMVSGHPVTTAQMLPVAMALYHQERFSGRSGLLSSCLTVLACLKHLYPVPTASSSDDSEGSEPIMSDDADSSSVSSSSKRAANVEEDQYIFRFPWLKSTYKDRNFDLVDASESVKCGHLLMATSGRLPVGLQQLGPTLTLLGRVLAGDYEKALELLLFDDVILTGGDESSMKDFNQIALSMAKFQLNDVIAAAEPADGDKSANSDDDSSSSNADAANEESFEVVDNDDSSKKTKPPPANRLLDELQQKYRTAVEGIIIPDDGSKLAGLFRQQLVAILPDLEAEDIQHQQTLIATDWPRIREAKIRRQVALYDKHARLTSIGQELATLQERMETLRFLEDQKQIEERYMATPIVLESPEEVGWKDQEIIKKVDEAPIPDDADYQVPELGRARSAEDARSKWLKSG